MPQFCNFKYINESLCNPVCYDIVTKENTLTHQSSCITINRPRPIHLFASSSISIRLADWQLAIQKDLNQLL